MTFLAGLRHDRIDAPMLIEGAIDGASFRAWVEQSLVPTLRPGDVVVLDNLGVHKGLAIRAAIRRAGAHLLFLPAYSPDPLGIRVRQNRNRSKGRPRENQPAEGWATVPKPCIRLAH
jgi:transposase